MQRYSSEPDPNTLESQLFKINREVSDLNEIKWTIENLEGILTPGQKELKEVPGENEIICRAKSNKNTHIIENTI